MKKPEFYCTKFIECQNNLPIYQPKDCTQQCHSCMDIIIDYHEKKAAKKRNKREKELQIINGAINQLECLLKNEPIKLNGLHSITITRGKITDEKLHEMIQELKKEQHDKISK